MVRLWTPLLVLFWMCLCPHGVRGEKFDVLLQGGTVVDGTGGPRRVADVAVRDGKIVVIGDLKDGEAERTISAKGLIVTPGFIDMMGQTATPMLDDPKAAMNMITQGITTINAGEGASAAPLNEAQAAHARWQTMAEYFQILDLKGLPINVVQTVGHTQVRRIVLGDSDKRPTDADLERMKALVQEAMEAGAIGVSSALIYPPAVYADSREIGELAAVAGKYGGRYYTHIRNEGDSLLEAIDEALEIGRVGDVPVHIFHLKAAGGDNWPKMRLALDKVNAARTEGRQVCADIYPYVNNGLGIGSFIHPRHFAQGRADLIRRIDDPDLRQQIRREMETEPGWENWYRHVGKDWKKVVVGKTSDERYAPLAGKSLGEIAETLNEDPWDTFFALVKSGAFAMPETMSEDNKKLAMQQPYVSFCTDVGPVSGSRIASHPRASGSFPRLIARYVREQGVLSLEQAVAQASAVAAASVLRDDRGRITEGQAADLIVFDYEKITDTATFAEPGKLSEGMKYVLVNGQVVFEDGKLTGARPGRVLRGPGYDPAKAPSAVSTGKVDSRMASFDRLMKEFMEHHHVPGAALAVTDHGRLVYARGFGYADVAARQKVKPTSLFRIASISKPFTAVAVLQLVEQGRLSLDDKVFDVLGWSAFQDEGVSFDERLKDVTIRHLLQHRGGWDRSKSFDAMFRSVPFAEAQGVSPPAGQDAIIRCMFTQPLDFTPGERYAYSNYGFCLLGRVLEKVTGRPYADCVRQEVLLPLGIKSMVIGHTRQADRQDGEVRYYDPSLGKSVFEADLGQSVAWPYGGWHHEAMDSHGAWLASAVDLARFAAAFDAPESCLLLSRDTIQAMYSKPDEEPSDEGDGGSATYFYSYGWQNRNKKDGGVDHWHTGSIPGTATLLVRRHDGRNWVVLFNARVSPYASHLGKAIDSLLHRAANEVSQWPEYDLFEEFR